MSWLSAIGRVIEPITSVLGVGSSLQANERQYQESKLNRQLQLDTLHNQIQWRVEDAKKAGIHPMAALGFTGMSYSPVSTAFQGTDFSGMGQDISRAVMAGQTERERQAAAGRATLEASQNDAYHALQLDNMQLQNDMLRSQIARFNSAQVGPPAPAPGSVELQPDRVVVGSQGAPARSPGMVTDYAFGPTASGGYSMIPSYDIKQRIEDSPMEWQWFLRNGIVPNVSVFRDLERQHPSRPGFQWRYNPLAGEFYQQRIRQGDRRYY